MSAKIAVMDASSAIILYKAGLHAIVTETYKVILPGSVFAEITSNAYPGAEAYRHLEQAQAVTLKEVAPALPDGRNGGAGHKLHRGESDVIALYCAGHGDFIITDDGAAAKLCKRESIPFVNALLVPVLLHLAGLKDALFCRASFQKILAHGRYSPEIIAFAEGCRRHELSFFIPEP